MSRPKLLVICGPTSTGKTQLALSLAYEFKGELVNADSRQMYKGLDVLTGKDIPENFTYQNSKIKYNDEFIGFYGDGTKIWLIDYVDQDKIFTVYDYQKIAKIVIQDIWSRNQLPILIGGSGLYLSSLVGLYQNFSVPPDYQFRKKIENYSVKDLQNMLRKVNPDRLDGLNNSDRYNPRRLMRSLELSNYKKTNNNNDFYKHTDILKVGLTLPIKKLEQKIKLRIKYRIQKGVLDDIQFKKNELHQRSPSQKTIGLDILKKMSSGEISQFDGIHQWFFKERQYAKRQLTWFQKDKDIVWFDVADKTTIVAMTDFIRSWYTREYADSD